MKFVHISDLHLGKRVNEFSMIEDQEYILTKIINVIDEYKPDIFVCGHSHILKVVRDTKRNMLVLNPGAAGIQGFHMVRTALRFRIEDGRIHSMEVFELDR